MPLYPLCSVVVSARLDTTAGVGPVNLRTYAIRHVHWKIFSYVDCACAVVRRFLSPIIFLTKVLDSIFRFPSSRKFYSYCFVKYFSEIIIGKDFILWRSSHLHIHTPILILILLICPHHLFGALRILSKTMVSRLKNQRAAALMIREFPFPKYRLQIRLKRLRQ